VKQYYEWNCKEKRKEQREIATPTRAALQRNKHILLYRQEVKKDRKGEGGRISKKQESRLLFMTARETHARVFVCIFTGFPVCLKTRVIRDEKEDIRG
jgi:hypothetical protein